jgi:hypothetical protein
VAFPKQLSHRLFFFFKKYIYIYKVHFQNEVDGAAIKRGAGSHFHVQSGILWFSSFSLWVFFLEKS